MIQSNQVVMTFELTLGDIIDALSFYPKMVRELEKQLDDNGALEDPDHTALADLILAEVDLLNFEDEIHDGTRQFLEEYCEIDEEDLD